MMVKGNLSAWIAALSAVGFIACGYVLEATPVQWSLPLPSIATTTLEPPFYLQRLPGSDRYVMASTAQNTTAFVDVLKPKVHCTLPNVTDAILMDDIGVLVVLTSDALLGYDFLTCRRRWQQPDLQPASLVSMCSKSLVEVVATNGLSQVFNATSGAFVNQLNFSYQSVCASDTFVISNTEGSLAAYDTTSLALKWTHSPPTNYYVLKALAVRGDELIVSLRGPTCRTSQRVNLSTGEVLNTCAPYLSEPSDWTPELVNHTVVVASLSNGSAHDMQFFTADLATCENVTQVQTTPDWMNKQCNGIATAEPVCDEPLIWCAGAGAAAGAGLYFLAHTESNGIASYAIIPGSTVSVQLSNVGCALMVATANTITFSLTSAPMTPVVPPIVSAAILNSTTPLVIGSMVLALTYTASCDYATLTAWNVTVE